MFCFRTASHVPVLRSSAHTLWYSERMLSASCAPAGLGAHANTCLVTSFSVYWCCGFPKLPCHKQAASTSLFRSLQGRSKRSMVSCARDVHALLSRVDGHVLSRAGLQQLEWLPPDPSLQPVIYFGGGVSPPFSPFSYTLGVISSS